LKDGFDGVHGGGWIGVDALEEGPAMRWRERWIRFDALEEEMAMRGRKRWMGDDEEGICPTEVGEGRVVQSFGVNWKTAF
jgi:hypothetical protein